MTNDEAQVLVDMLLVDGGLETPRGVYLEVVGDEKVKVEDPVMGKSLEPEISEELERRGIEHKAYLAVIYTLRDGPSDSWRSKMIVVDWSEEDARTKFGWMLEDGTSELWPTFADDDNFDPGSIEKDEKQRYDNSDEDFLGTWYTLYSHPAEEQEFYEEYRAEGDDEETARERADQDAQTLIAVEPTEIQVFGNLKDAEQWTGKEWPPRYRSEIVDNTKEDEAEAEVEVEENPQRSSLKRKLMR